MVFPVRIMLALALAALLEITQPFLLENNCIAPRPCTCYSNVIYCSKQRLRHLPSFSVYNGQMYKVQVILDYNELGTIPDFAFTNLSSLHANDIDMFLNNNFLYEINLHAFDGIEGAIRYLNLMNNNFTHLPPGLKSLAALKMLYLDGNPLINLDEVILSELAVLSTFGLSIDHFTVFPSEIRNLSHLTELRINKIPFPSIPLNSFYGLEELSSLKMSFSKLEKIPSSICNLTHLQTLYFQYSQNLEEYNDPIFDACFKGMASLENLYLGNNNMSIFPNISNLFPNLTNLYISNNMMRIITADSLDYKASLKSFHLSFNSFVRIPEVLDKSTSLQNLDMSGNQILSLEDFDVQNLHGLKNLKLSLNPLIYVSPYAFLQNPLLEQIDFAYTKVDSIPLAVLGLTKLGVLNMNGNHIDCSCHAMSYLKQWNFTSVDIKGYCKQGITIKTYLRSYFSNC